MVSISNNGIIELSRGDSFCYPLFIDAGDRISPIRVRIGEKDTVYFSVCEPNQPFECGIIRKVYNYTNTNSKGDVMIKLDYEDTVNIVPGIYYYEVKIRLNNGNVSTIIPKRKFILYE